MLLKVSKTVWCGVLAVLCGVTSAPAATEPLDTTLEDAAEYWSPLSTSPKTGEEKTGEETAETDNEVTPVQMLAPQARSPRTARRPSRSSIARRSAALASVPFMIGDTGAGSCLSYGSLLDVELAHPTLACSRLNISESNTPIPTDRLYYSYRHFHNATPTSVFGITEDFDINRHTLGGERTFFSKMLSMEIRVPIDDRLNSQVGTQIVNPGSTVFTPGFDVIAGAGGQDTRVELGNIAMIFKALLFERSDFAISAGLGVTLPTARDVTYDSTIDENFISPEAPFLARHQILISSIASNETVYLSPFLAWVWQKTPRFYHQGFLQVETAANSSFFTAGGFGQSTFDTNGDTIVNIPADAGDDFIIFSDPLPLGIAKIQPQTLLRLNLGWGYVLSENPQASWIQKLTGLFELHYTTTLNDATINTIPFFVTTPTFTGFGTDGISVGNRDNRIDILNAVAGVSANVGNWVVTNGVTAPIRTGADRGFDFEYNLQLQRPF